MTCRIKQNQSFFKLKDEQASAHGYFEKSYALRVDTKPRFNDLTLSVLAPFEQINFVGPPSQSDVLEWFIFLNFNDLSTIWNIGFVQVKIKALRLQCAPTFRILHLKPCKVHLASCDYCQFTTIIVRSAQYLHNFVLERMYILHEIAVPQRIKYVQEPVILTNDDALILER